MTLRRLPALLPGSRCYTDASSLPDQIAPLVPKTAGLGVFLINMQVHPPQNIYIKAVITNSTSVIMAEAAAMALAAAVSERLQLQHTNFLTDNQELVKFFNSADCSDPPDWRIKHLTQLFINHTQNRSTRTFKINRNQNQTADTLARQALQLSYDPQSEFACTCSHSAHTNQCTLIDALQFVHLNSVSVLAASRC